MSRLTLRAIARHVTAAAAVAAEEEEEQQEEPAAKIELEKLHPDFGARLHHVDLEALTDEQWGFICKASVDMGFGERGRGRAMVKLASDYLATKGILDEDKNC